MLNQITPIILTFNEQDNIERSLTALYWAQEIIIIDSGSTDDTLSICRKFNNVRIVTRQFDNFANQCNFALKQNIKTQWVLSMDADYIVSPELVAELQYLKPSVLSGYKITFQYLIFGKPLHGSLYPPRTSLYKRDCAHYQQDGHAHKVIIEGELGELVATIQHDDRKPFGRWLQSQWKYAKQEAIKLNELSWSTLSTPDKLRKMGIAPLIIFPYTFLLKGLIVNGIPGLVYSTQRLIAEVYLQAARIKQFAITPN